MAIISLVVGPKDPRDTSESLGMPTGSKKALGSNPITTFFSYNTCMYTLFIYLKRCKYINQGCVAERLRCTISL